MTTLQFEFMSKNREKIDTSSERVDYVYISYIWM